MNQREFQKRLAALLAEREGSFGYPFLSLAVLAEAMALSPAELTKHVEQERTAGRVVMNPIDEKTEANLPAAVIALRFADADGTVKPYVSLALKPGISPG